jgi:spartin
MSRGNDPRLFFSIDNIRAFHIQDGDETELTPSGPQTLSLLMVPTASPFDPSQPGDMEEDFYLHLHIPPELDLPLPATTQIYHQPPDSYLIPRWDLGPGSDAFTRIQFPGIGSGPDKVTQEDVDTFETILAQCTAFLERASPPYHTPYNPSHYAPGEGYVGAGPEKSQKQQHGQIVLVDEEDGSVVGELTDGFTVVEATDIKPGSKGMQISPIAMLQIR